LEETDGLLEVCEAESAPAGWRCNWSRKEKQYYYIHEISEDISWTYPEEDVEAVRKLASKHKSSSKSRRKTSQPMGTLSHLSQAIEAKVVDADLKALFIEKIIDKCAGDSLASKLSEAVTPPDEGKDVTPPDESKGGEESESDPAKVAYNRIQPSKVVSGSDVKAVKRSRSPESDGSASDDAHRSKKSKHKRKSDKSEKKSKKHSKHKKDKSNAERKKSKHKKHSRSRSPDSPVKIKPVKDASAELIALKRKLNQHKTKPDPVVDLTEESNAKSSSVRAGSSVVSVRPISVADTPSSSAPPTKHSVSLTDSTFADSTTCNAVTKAKNLDSLTVRHKQNHPLLTTAEKVTLDSVPDVKDYPSSTAETSHSAHMGKVKTADSLSLTKVTDSADSAGGVSAANSETAEQSVNGILTDKPSSTELLTEPCAEEMDISPFSSPASSRAPSLPLSHPSSPVHPTLSTSSTGPSNDTNNLNHRINSSSIDDFLASIEVETQAKLRKQRVASPPPPPPGTEDHTQLSTEQTTRYAKAVAPIFYQQPAKPLPSQYTAPMFYQQPAKPVLTNQQAAPVLAEAPVIYSQTSSLNDTSQSSYTQSNITSAPAVKLSPVKVTTSDTLVQPNTSSESSADTKHSKDKHKTKKSKKSNKMPSALVQKWQKVQSEITTDIMKEKKLKEEMMK